MPRAGTLEKQRPRDSAKPRGPVPGTRDSHRLHPAWTSTTDTVPVLERSSASSGPEPNTRRPTPLHWLHNHARHTTPAPAGAGQGATPSRREGLAAPMGGWDSPSSRHPDKKPPEVPRKSTGPRSCGPSAGPRSGIHTHALTHTRARTPAVMSVVRG